MSQANVWSTGEATEIALVQPRLARIASYQERQAPTLPGGSVVPDASLFLIPICFVAVWAIVAFPFFRELSKSRMGSSPFLRVSKIPCRNCQFFSKNSYLKCAVHPATAMTEEATNCSDYSSK